MTHQSSAGRLTQFHCGTNKHALSAGCYLHSKCSMLRKIAHFKDIDPQSIMLRWLHLGKQFKKRQDSHQHMGLSLHMKMYVFVSFTFLFVVVLFMLVMLLIVFYLLCFGGGHSTRMIKL